VIPRLAKRQVARELLFCHCASRKRSEYVTCVAVRHECLRRRQQLAFIGPPASVQFYELPSLIHHLDLPHSSSASRFTAGAAGLFILSQSGDTDDTKTMGSDIVRKRKAFSVASSAELMERRVPMRQICTPQDLKVLAAASAAALIVACVGGWVISDTQARVATPTVQIDPFALMTSAKQLPTEHFADYSFVF
jgi:hypothetical protein